MVQKQAKFCKLYLIHLRQIIRGVGKSQATQRIRDWDSVELSGIMPNLVQGTLKIWSLKWPAPLKRHPGGTLPLPLVYDCHIAALWSIKKITDTVANSRPWMESNCTKIGDEINGLGRDQGLPKGLFCGTVILHCGTAVEQRCLDSNEEKGALLCSCHSRPFNNRPMIGPSFNEGIWFWD